MRDNENLEIIFQVLLSCMQKECHPTDQLREETIEKLIKSVTKQFKSESPLLTLSGSFVVVGDLHGNLNFLIRLFQTLHYPSSGLSSPNTNTNQTANSAETSRGFERKYLFLGDYVDRGENSLEVLLLLYALKLRYPNHIYLLRGNHETSQFKKNSSFRTECLVHLTEDFYKSFLRSFAFMPIVAIVNGVLCLHGGLSPSLMTLEDIQKLPVPIKDLNGNPAADILWSDPDSSVDYYQDSPRGFGYLFGQDPLGVFLEDNNLKAMIRGHQFCHSGFLWNFGPDSDCLTLSSSTNYNQSGSSAAVAIVSNDGSITVQTFEPLNSEQLDHFRILFPEWILSCVSSFEKVSQEHSVQTVNFVDYADFLSPTRVIE